GGPPRVRGRDGSGEGGGRVRPPGSAGGWGPPVVSPLDVTGGTMPPPAVKTLESPGVPFTLREYEVVGAVGEGYGEAVAVALGTIPERVFKTLMAVVDDRHVVAVVPVSERLSTKSLAQAAGGKKASMADPADAERLTGYVSGGISPF